ncbi:MAG: SPASM domain-containing protein [Xanthomonadales bacterium]|nr:SPASM domain-containing protein [Xanthomonadales bacterium]
MNLFSKRLPVIDIGASSATRIAPLPRVLWIELTSRCPFDCVFCSRKLLRGAGKHMDFDLYRRLIAELRNPDIIRLNYSGESSHYPKIVEACTLASATGATVELVSVLAALPQHRVDALAHSGLSRLTISLHSLDADKFAEIYRFSTVDAMRERIERIVSLAPALERPLAIDFAFVAMQRNLDQLEAVADYASELGIQRLAVHPVIRRDPIEETFVDELDGDRLRPAFLERLGAAIKRVADKHPQLSIESSTPELHVSSELDQVPRYFPAELPAQARIHRCDQDPWETVHILSDGAVVSCEERDRIVLGNLARQSLTEIWHGPDYAQFRDDYVHARDAKCRRCPYKVAHAPAPLPSRIGSGEGEIGLLDGWLSDSERNFRWSRPQATLRLAGGGAGRLRVSGLLPQGLGEPNRLSLRANGIEIAKIVNRGADMHRFEIERRLVVGDFIDLHFDVDQIFCPGDRGIGPDRRKLGFALIEAAFARQGGRTLE